MIPQARPDRFRTAARAYLGYGAVYLVGGVYLLVVGVGVPGEMPAGRRAAHVALWTVAGAAIMLLVPFLLRRRRRWFERWILCRRDFARLLALFMAYRAFVVARVAIRGDGAAVPAPWGGEITFQAGAAVFFVVTVAALVLVAAAAWQADGP
jgi:hypothetical protein